MECPNCKYTKSQITHSYHVKNGVKRDRYCYRCESHYMTLETVLAHMHNNDDELTNVSSALAVKVIMDSIRNGETVSIPSLGIEIEGNAMNERVDGSDPYEKDREKRINWLESENQRLMSILVAIPTSQDLEEAVSLAFCVYETEKDVRRECECGALSPYGSNFCCFCGESFDLPRPPKFDIES